jgi:hypothetical protein
MSAAIVLSKKKNHHDGATMGGGGGCLVFLSDCSKWTPEMRSPRSSRRPLGENGKRKGPRPPRAAARQTRKQTLSAHPRRKEEPTRKAKQDDEKGP